MTELLANKYVLWTGFNLLVLLMLAIDLGFFHRKDHRISIKEGLIWSAIWIVVALIFNVLYYFWQGHEKALEFLTGYIIERSLSIDNIFVFLMLFTFFAVPAKYQYKVLFWGIIGALVTRMIFILVGTFLITRFHWLIYIFGAFLIYSGIQMGLSKEEKIEPEKNPLIKFIRKFLPITPHYVDGKFFTRQNGRLFATPLFVVLVAVESSDIIFAFDSIPAIFAITLDPFIVYTSNVFAILGLRALYFAVAGLMDVFYYLKYGLSAILVFVGIKMLIVALGFKIPTWTALIVVGGILLASVVASLIWPKKPEVKIELPK